MPDNTKRGEEALSKLERELKSRDRKEKTRPLGVVAAAAVIILAIVGGIYFASTRDGEDEKVNAEESTATSSSAPESPAPTALSGKRAEALPETVECTYEKSGEDPNGATIPDGKKVSAKGTVTVNFHTNQGEIPLELDRSLAPCATHAIASLAKSGFYDGSICHRMTSGMLNVLQCGDPTGSGSGGPGFRFATEYPEDETKQADLAKPVIYPRGSVAMANTGQPVSSGSQFFLNYADSTLAPTYTYFGNVTEEGLKTLDKIAEAGVKDGAGDGAPAEEVKIDKAELAE